jgi:Protein of unknown function (DUF3486)
MAKRAAKQEGRGRLSSIDLLPPEADEDIVWANEALRERKLPQTVILAEFNERLLDRRFEPISKGAWSRYSVRKAVQWRGMDEDHRVMGEIHAALDVKAPDEVTLVIGEMLKLAVFRQLESGDASVKELAGLARVLRNAVLAQADTVEYRKSLAELNERLAKVAEVVAAASAPGGTTKDTLDKIRVLMTTGAA